MNNGLMELQIQSYKLMRNRSNGWPMLIHKSWVKNKITSLHKVSKTAKIRNRYNQLLHLTQDTIWESDNNTRKHNVQESQDVSPFPACDHKAAMNRQESMTNTKYK